MAATASHPVEKVNPFKQNIDIELPSPDRKLKGKPSDELASGRSSKQQEAEN